ncbi:MAG: hypothetical protein Q4F67_15345 [Propionibacteriaceae bacterium]|nr:hypothetical protein [Propionibacteriaceae bacterium]
METYLSLAGFAKEVGLDVGTIKRYNWEGRLPEPDATIGRTYGWRTETAQQWARVRPPVRPRNRDAPAE